MFMILQISLNCEFKKNNNNNCEISCPSQILCVHQSYTNTSLLTSFMHCAGGQVKGSFALCKLTEASNYHILCCVKR